MNESQIQAACVLKFSQTYPERRGDLFSTFQETTNAIQGSNMLSKGLIPGVPDMFLVNTCKNFIPIEMKAPNTRHDLIHILEQCRFIIENAGNGFFCTSVDSFWEIVISDGLSGGIPADTVRSWCTNKMKSKLGEFSWKNTDDLIFLANKWEKKSGKKMPTVRF